MVLRLFDAELAAERVASAGESAAAPGELTTADRDGLIDGLGAVREALRDQAPMATLETAQRLTGALTESGRLSGVVAHRLALAIEGLVNATAMTRSLAEHAAGGPSVQSGQTTPKPSQAPAASAEETGEGEDPEGSPRSMADRLRPTTRQAIQVAIATALAIVAGELISTDRPLVLAVIAAFVIFNGTTSRGEVLSKGWQRLLGTLAGVVAGALIASVVHGNTYITLVVAIGVAVAATVLPTSTRPTISHDTRQFLAGLSALIGHVGDTMLGHPPEETMTNEARQLDACLQTLRSSAKPLASGIAGRSHIRRGMRVMMACDHYARSLVRLAEPVPAESPLPDSLGQACTRVRANVDALATMLADQQPATVCSAQPALDAAEATLQSMNGGKAWSRIDSRRVLGVLRYLRRIDQALVELAGAVNDRSAAGATS